MSGETTRTILLVDDNPAEAGLLREHVSQGGADNVAMIHVKTMTDAEEHLSRHAVDLVLLDPAIADASGIDAIRRARTAAPRVPVVVLTDLDDEALAQQALREGAQDYHVRGQIQVPALLRSLNYAIERKRRESLKDEYIATVSHELRAPLTSIAGSLGLLLEHWGGRLPDAATRLVAIAQTSSQRLGRLVDDVLDIERFETTNNALALGGTDIHRLLEQAIDGCRGFAARYGVRVNLDIAALRGEVKADPDRLIQVVINLLSNAIKASPADGEVVVAADMNERSVRISVRDHGAGVPADLRPHIFQRFAQGHRSYPRQRGSGLGLSIVKTIVERAGGKVWLDDAPGGGTIAYAELPALDREQRASISRSAENRTLKFEYPAPAEERHLPEVLR